MSSSFWKKLNHYGTWVFVSIIFSFLAFMLGVEIKDYDLWLHLAMGKQILETGVVPEVDILSFTRAGAPWSNHEWLFQVINYWAYSFAGEQGIVNIQTVVVMATVGMLFMMGYNRDRPLMPILVLLLVILVYKSRFTHRPDLFSLFYFSSFVFVLSSHLHKKWSLFVLFILQVLWTNTHGFFIFGPLMMGIGIVAEYVRRFIPLPFEWGESGNLDRKEFTRLHIGFFVVCAACFINPSFVDGVVYPLKIMFSLGGDSKVFFDYIVELKKPITRDTLFVMEPYFYYRLLILISAFSFILNIRRIDISALFMWGVFLVFSLNAARNIVFFAVMAYFAVLVNMQYVVTDETEVPVSKTTECLLSLICKIVIGAWLIQTLFALSTNGYYDFDIQERKPEFDGKFTKINHPYKAVDFLVDNNVEGNLLNDFNSGAYLIGRTHPNIKVFIDGRTELYGSEFFLDQTQIMKGDTKLLKEALNKYPITGAFLNTQRRTLAKDLVKYFHESTDWKLVYFDYDAVIYLKDIPQNEKLIEVYNIDLKEWESPLVDLFDMGLKLVPSYQPQVRGQILYKLGLLDKATEEAEKAIEIHPGDGRAYHLLGQIEKERGNYEEAFKWLRQSRVLAGKGLELSYDIGEVYLHTGRVKKAEELCDEILKNIPDRAKFLFLSARIDITQDKYDEVINKIEKVKQLKFRHIVDLMEIAALLEERDQNEIAREVYEKIVEIDDEAQEAQDRLEQLKT